MWSGHSDGARRTDASHLKSSPHPLAAGLPTLRVTTTTELVRDYDYDYLDRLKSFVGYDTGTNTKTGLLAFPCW